MVFMASQNRHINNIKMKGGSNYEIWNRKEGANAPSYFFVKKYGFNVFS